MKYTENGIQYHIGLKQGDVGKYVILPGDPKRCEKIAAYFEHPVLIVGQPGICDVYRNAGGRDRFCNLNRHRRSSAAIAMEELVKAGAHTFIRVGTCGGIDTEVQSGDLSLQPVRYELRGRAGNMLRSNIRQSQTWM